MPAYKESFPVGSLVRIADLAALKNFQDTWKWHNPLEQTQLAHADSAATVEKFGFYHGGDVLYELCGVPGIWHETCLVASNT